MSQHNFYIQTKRSARLRQYCSTMKERAGAIAQSITTGTGNLFADPAAAATAATAIQERLQKGFLANVALGVSAEDQETYDGRIADLMATPAAERWVSLEPLLGLVDLRLHQYRTSIDWVVFGGETGPGARPMHPDWAREVRNACCAHQVPFVFRQWGEWMPVSKISTNQAPRPSGSGPSMRTRMSAAQSSEILCEKTGIRYLMSRVGKKAAGRMLDGKIHDGMLEAGYVLHL